MENSAELCPEGKAFFQIHKRHLFTNDSFTDILSVPLIGLVPDDENVVVATNQGETLIGETSPAGYAYQNICERIIGKEVPFMNLEKGFSFWTKFSGIFHRA